MNKPCAFGKCNYILTLSTKIYSVFSLYVPDTLLGSLCFTFLEKYIVKNSEGSEILHYLEANMLACHNYIAIGRRCEPSESHVYYILI